jgi:hypothetical protein
VRESCGTAALAAVLNHLGPWPGKRGELLWTGVARNQSFDRVMMTRDDARMAGSWYRLFSHLALENSTLVRHRLLNDVTRSGRPVEMHKKNNGDPWKCTKSDNSKSCR